MIKISPYLRTEHRLCDTVTDKPAILTHPSSANQREREKEQFKFVRKKHIPQAARSIKKSANQAYIYSIKKRYKRAY